MIDRTEIQWLKTLNKNYEARIRLLSDELYKTEGAIKTLESEREANEILTNQVEYLLMVIAILLRAK